MNPSSIAYPSVAPGSGVYTTSEQGSVVVHFVNNFLNSGVERALHYRPDLQPRLARLHEIEHLPADEDPLVQLCYLTTIRSGSAKRPWTRKQAEVLANHRRLARTTNLGFKWFSVAAALLTAAGGFVAFVSASNLAPLQQATIVGVVVFLTSLATNLLALKVTGTDPAKLAEANDERQDHLGMLERHFNHLGAYFMELAPELAAALARHIDCDWIRQVANEEVGLNGDAAGRIWSEFEAMVLYFRDGKAPLDAKLSRSLRTHHLLEFLVKKIA